MKRFFLITYCFFSAAVAYAQPKGDSVAYQLERSKINAMLAQRAQKFGQYDQSLTMHTGIFGLQTKKDIRRSNDILMDIVKTDDAIYREIKILLDFRAFQQTQVQSHAKEIEDNTIGYMNTINKLRAQVDQLKAEADKQQQEDGKTDRIYIILLTLALVTILLLARRKTRRKA